MLFGVGVVAVWAIATLSFYLLPQLMADVYDLLIVRMTTRWYAAVLKELSPRDRLLDVGIGTASALVRNRQAILDGGLFIVGIDYEKPYIDKAIGVVAKAGLKEQVLLHCKSIYDPALRQVFTGKARFDAAYFSGSLTLMPDPPGALKAASNMLHDGGLIYVTQTFQNKPAPLMARLKPLLRRFTTVDFGKLTYYHEIAGIVEAAGMQIVRDEKVPGSIDTPSQTARLLVLKTEPKKRS